MSYRILFVPVSSPEGVGEYMRSLMIAQSLASQDCDFDIQFILNEQAPYAHDCPYAATLCPSSPTLHSDIVNRVIKAFKPEIVIFDASGRVSQLKAAKEAGAHTIFIAQHNRKLRKGLNWSRLTHTDKVFVVQPKEFSPPLTTFQQLKRRLLAKPTPQFIGPIFPEVNSQRQSELLRAFSLKHNDFILVSSGGGSHNVNGVDANSLFSDVASVLGENTSSKCLLVCGEHKKRLKPCENIIETTTLPPVDFITLLSSAKLAVLGGGGSLLQALALNVPVVCIPLAKDQYERIQKCAKFYGTIYSEPQVDSIASAAIEALKRCSGHYVSSNTLTSGLPIITQYIRIRLGESHFE